MKHFITYSDAIFKEGKELLLNEARNLSMFDTVSGFSEDIIPKDIKKILKDILKCKKGGGFYAWKPVVLRLTLDSIADNDILVYADAGCTIINNEKSKMRLAEYFEMVSDKDKDKPIIRFELDDNCKEYKYTNTKIFEHFNVCGDEYIVKSNQYVGGILILRKCEFTVDLINEWLNTLLNTPLLFTNFYNNYKRNPEFIDNRHDQSILSILTKLNKNKVWSIPNETYPYNEDFPILAIWRRK